MVDESTVREIRALKAKVARLEKRQVRFWVTTVLAVDTVASTITVAVPASEGGGSLAGIRWPAQFLPDVGTTVRLPIAGTQVQQAPNALAADAVSNRELATGAVSDQSLQPSIVLSTSVTGGVPTAEHVTLDTTGLGAYAYDEGLPVQTAQYGQDQNFWDPSTGQVTASITRMGDAAFGTLTVDDTDITVGGQTLADRDWDRPWGLVGYASLPDINAYTTASTSELGFLEMAWDLVPGRAYKLTSEPIQYNSSTGDAVRLRVRLTTDGTSPSTSSTLFREIAYQTNATGWVDRHPINLYMGGIAAGGAAQTWRILLTYSAGTGATLAEVWRGEVMYFWIEDMGPLRADIGQLVGTGNGGGTGGTTTVKKDYTYEAGAVWERTWQPDNVTEVTVTEMQQGYGDSFNGNRRASAGFADVTSMLSGATITKVLIYMESYWWWYTTGGTLRLGTHGTLAEPGSFPGHNNIHNVTFTARNQGKWIDVTGWANWVSGIQSGTVRGISIGGADNSAIYYGKFHGLSYGRPRWKIYYTK